MDALLKTEWVTLDQLRRQYESGPINPQDFLLGIIRTEPALYQQPTSQPLPPSKT